MEKIFQFMLIPGLTFFSPIDKALAQWRGYGQGMGPGMMGWGYGMGWFGMILMALFWIAVIVRNHFPDQVASLFRQGPRVMEQFQKILLWKF